MWSYMMKTVARFFHTKHILNVKIRSGFRGVTPGVRPLFALICNTNKINVRPPVQSDNLYGWRRQVQVFLDPRLKIFNSDTFV